MSHKNQSGFIMMAVVTVIVVAVLGLVGWSLFGHYYNNQYAARTPSVICDKPSICGPSGTPNETATPQPTYLDIKELGVRIKLDDSIKDAIYTIHTKLGGSQFADISTQTLTNKSSGKCSPDNGSIAAVEKISGTPGIGIDPVNNSTTFKFGTNTYVYISGPQQICSDDKTVQNLADQQRATFFNDFKTVQLDN